MVSEYRIETPKFGCLLPRILTEDLHTGGIQVMAMI